MEAIILEATILLVFIISILLRHIKQGDNSWKLLLIGALLYLVSYVLKFGTISLFGIVSSLSEPVKAIGDISVVLGCVSIIVALLREK